jgi:hypothetical protein
MPDAPQPLPLAAPLDYASPDPDRARIRPTRRIAGALCMSVGALVTGVGGILLFTIALPSFPGRLADNSDFYAALAFIAVGSILGYTGFRLRRRERAPGPSTPLTRRPLRPTRNAWIGLGLVGVLILQPALLFLAYATLRGNFYLVGSIALPVALVLNIVLFIELLPPLAAVPCAFLATFAGTYLGMFAALNIYGA